MTKKEQLRSLIEDAWHDSEEEPTPQKFILAERKDLHGNTYQCDTNHGRWEVYRRINNIIRWAYIEDLIPTNK